ncbi:o-succinylbenzoate synthase [Mycobacterium antarcticum]|uniref:enolase C-terminal domain-like protein n=1 Tax=unclassified Mycolicibacterium TaxID=2636767 RepID=UPI0023A42A00|nr:MULTISPECIES: enolase C-terminal domain-like protein [unclassified Mycolicibacterium]BDX31983.1 o-succinylbenzoate synthase [Mycolicibacterium sp. TUM20985]GLP81074.1 o-succinylbenzoate synthase [Mycolicibacterium sp. TUM20984]
MKAFIDFDTAPVFGIPTSDGSGVREGMLLEGPQAWGEFSPPPDSDDRETARWLTAAMEGGTVGWPDPVRGRIAIAVAVPAVDPAETHRIVVDSGCLTADVTVTATPDSLAADLARVEAVREALGPRGSIRFHTNKIHDVDDAVLAIARLAKAAGALEFVAAPWRTPDELAAVRRGLDVPVAASAWLADGADVAILRSGPLGGVRRALRLAERLERPCVVSSSNETSIGLASGLALAGALPELPFACGLGTITLLTGDVVAERRSLRPVAGYLPVAPMAAEPAPEFLARYALTDRGRIDWWRRRLQVVVG